MNVKTNVAEAVRCVACQLRLVVYRVMHVPGRIAATAFDLFYPKDLSAIRGGLLPHVNFGA